ncbi:MAG: hypothetical protein QNJ90_06260 [Planctomycetota bacterium]|nr:hypothetical protein [Planctomycetota bacterium]
MSRILIAVLLVVSLGGCLQSKDAVVINKDGSGTISSTYTTELQHLRDLMGLYASMQGEDPDAVQKIPDGELPNAAAPAWFRAGAAATKGYDITNAEQTIEDGKRKTTINARFASLEAAARGGAFFASTVTLSRVEKSEKAPKGAWKLTMRNALSGGGQADAMGGMDPATALQMVEAQLGSLSVKVSLSVPTKILDHNGTKHEKKNEVSWHVNYDKIVEGKTDVTMSIVFEPSDELKLKPFTYSPDARKLARRAMNKPPKPKKAATEKKKANEKKADADEKKPEPKSEDKKDG